MLAVKELCVASALPAYGMFAVSDIKDITGGHYTDANYRLTI